VTAKRCRGSTRSRPKLKLARFRCRGAGTALARVAGIESGAECDRLAPLLSALADGEATVADMTLLRPHLRTCLVCRARLRDYRAAPARVAAMAPPLAAGGLLALARDLLAALGVRWHQAAELVTGHKVAAVVASSAALAGGGAATVATVSDERALPGARAVAPARTTDRPASAPVAQPARAPTPAGRAPRRLPTATDKDAMRASASPPPVAAPSQGEFTPDADGHASADSDAHAQPRADDPSAETPGGDGGEFAP
jgi:hypothetical protein